jgi:hypothetical protein
MYNMSSLNSEGHKSELDENLFEVADNEDTEIQKKGLTVF